MSANIVFIFHVDHKQHKFTIEASLCSNTTGLTRLFKFGEHSYLIESLDEMLDILSNFGDIEVRQ